MNEVQDALANYDIGEVREVQVAGGTAGKCWHVIAATGNYFLRCRGTRTSSREAMQFDHGLRKHLVAGGVPTAEPIAATSGETWALWDGRAFELYRFVAGRAFGETQAELADTARALARFHLVAASYPARGSYSPILAQFANAAPGVGGSERMDDPEVMLAAYDHLAGQYPGLEGAVEQARRLASAYEAGVYDALPRWLIHGDYHPGNLLYSDSGEVAGIFDLDWACEHTRSRDLADGIYYFGGRRAAPFDNASIWSMTDAVEPVFGTATVFVDAYSELAPLSASEVRAIPLALRARWLAERLEGSAKVSPQQRTWFIMRDLERPLEWLDRQGEELIRRLTA